LVRIKNRSSNIYDLRRRPRKIEKWSDIISQSNIDISKSINYITAKQIKQITNEEGRLMAKIDKIEHLPRIFKEHNLFILPVSRKEYKTGSLYNSFTNSRLLVEKGKRSRPFRKCKFVRIVKRGYRG
jgi:uncharacterized protein DUF6996